MSKPFLTAIVMVDRNWGIGKNGDQLIYIPADLKRFKQLTICRPIICGRKTLETFPGGRPLPSRRNLILSKTMAPREDAEVFSSIEELLGTDSINRAFIVGGESVYKTLLPYTDTVMVTKVDLDGQADRFFPNLDKSNEWKVYEQSREQHSDGLPPFRYVTYCKI